MTHDAQGWVWVLDSIAAFAKTMIVQEPDKLRDSTSYVWPCHKVLVAEYKAVQDEGERHESLSSSSSIHLSFQVLCVLLSFQVLCLASCLSSFRCLCLSCGRMSNSFLPPASFLSGMCVCGAVS